MSGEIKLEVCVDSIASALSAVEGGAARIELCSALSEGGLTPTVGTMKVIRDQVNIPIYCMLRPRRGNDFVYSQQELDAIIVDIELLRAHGADGFVFGALTAERIIDVDVCRRVVQAAALPITFHRAFDLTSPTAMHETVECLKQLGFQRLLSSGFRQTAIEGSEFLAQLVAKHHRDIVIMPGAGINVMNLDEILTVTKCTEFHASAQAAANFVDNAGMECDETMGKQDIQAYTTTDVNVVRKMAAIARSKQS